MELIHSDLYLKYKEVYLHFVRDYFFNYEYVVLFVTGCSVKKMIENQVCY